MTKAAANGADHRPATDMVPAFRLAAAKFVIAERKRELLELQGPCSTEECRLHYAHSGPCDIREQR